MEIWKDITDYKGMYQVSNLGRVRSLDRIVWLPKNNRYRRVKGVILKPYLKNDGYLHINVSNLKRKTFNIHQLVAIVFHNHKPCGHDLVVNHKNFIKTDNRASNLEIVTTRQNSNRKHLKSSSKYVGVGWKKNINKWVARIVINGKKKHLGCFVNEYDAHLSYQKELKKLNKSL